MGRSSIMDIYEYYLKGDKINSYFLLKLSNLLLRSFLDAFTM